MTIKIDKKITGYSLVKDTPVAEVKEAPQYEKMNERITRPEELVGKTYKLKPPQSDHALYVTINDIILNQGTEHEIRRPFEILISSKNMEYHQWIVALTLVISSVLRKGGEVTFLVQELKSVFDPTGGYMKRGGRFMPSLVAEIGETIEKHFKSIGLMQADEMSPEVANYVASKKEAISTEAGTTYPPEAQLCKSCMTKAAVRLDGCMTCLSCGDAKCG